MLDSVKPFNECIRILLESVQLDPHFVEFYDWSKLLGHEPDNIQIVANEVASRDGKDIHFEGGWHIAYHDDSDFGHDKSLAIKPYAALSAGGRPILLYAGDGVTDLSSASQT
ncbi:hypothetical protein GX48_08272 [Paracoccidioides brasiliensis]|nr:hypothetical protein GX48_08272 [Paracoccidioides brasiliensis]